MFSYAWEGGRRKVDHIAREFKAAGIRIWMDTKNGLTHHLIDGMAEAVEESLAICCFITPEYQQSKYCKMELEYANHLDIPIIPCYLTDFQPRTWLGFLTAGLIRYDFSNDLYDTTLNQLIRYVKQDILKVKSIVSPRSNPFQVKFEDQPSPFQSGYACKSAVGQPDSDTEQSLSYKDSSLDIASRSTCSSFLENTLTQSSSYFDRYAIPTPISRTSRTPSLLKKRIDQHGSHNNTIQEVSWDYEDYL